MNAVKQANTGRSFLFLFLIALGIRLALFSLVVAQPLKFYTNSDAYNYEHIAVNLLNHGVFSSDQEPPLIPNLYRPPVYPGLMALLYAQVDRSPLPLVLLQILVGSLSSALLLLLAQALTFSPRVGWIAGLILALDPLIVFTTYQLITETLFVFFLVASMLLLARYFWARHLLWLVGAGVLLALASLTRPISQYLPIVLVPVFFLSAGRVHWKSALGGAFLFLILHAALTGLWAYRNYRVADVWTLSAITDTNLLYYRGRDVIAEVKGISEDEAELELEQWIHTRVEAGNLPQSQEIALMRRKALEIFRQYPAITLKIHAEGLLRVVLNPGFDLICHMLDRQGEPEGCEADRADGFLKQLSGKFNGMDGLEKLVSSWAVLLLAVLYLGFLLGSWTLVRHRQWVPLTFLLILVAYFSLLSAGGESVSRFRIPIIPFLALFAGIGYSTRNNLWRRE